MSGRGLLLFTPTELWRGHAKPSTAAARRRGLTLLELLLAVAICLMAIGVLVSVFLQQRILSEHTRNLTWATNDASRVIEELRKRNSGGGCVPSANAPAGFASWDAWLGNTGATGGGGKSVQPTPTTNELVVVTSSGTDPLSVIVAICWRNRNRIVGECTWNGAALSPNPGAGGNPAVTESPAMLSTLLTCR